MKRLARDQQKKLADDARLAKAWRAMARRRISGSAQRTTRRDRRRANERRSIG